MYDFLRHGSLVVLIRDHGIRAGDVWCVPLSSSLSRLLTRPCRFMLQNFDLAMASIKTALETLLVRTTEDAEDENDSDDGNDRAAGDEGVTGEDEIARPLGVEDGQSLPSLSRSIGTDAEGK